MLDLIIKNGQCYINGNLEDKDIAVKDGKILKIGEISEEAKDVYDAKNQTVLPGCIDTQTHFREPGSTDTEDLHSGSRAAVAGGITAVFEMPNTNPPTSNIKEFQRKLDLAKNRMYCNYAFYFGATADNVNQLAELKNLEGCCGIKLFAGSSTGNLLVADEKDIDKVLELESRHFGALAGQGLVNIHLKNYEKAILSYEKALEIYPSMKSPSVMINQIQKMIKKDSI